MAYQDEEDFVNQSAALPRGLPLSGGGGLPLSRPMPAATRSPMAQMIEQNLLRQVEAENKRGPLSRTIYEMGGLDPYAGTKQAAEFQKQQDQMRMQYMNATVGVMEKFATLDPETQKAAAPLFKGYISQLNGLAGVEAPEALIDTMMAQPGMAATAHAIFSQDKGYSDEERQLHMAAIRRERDPAKVQAYLTKVQDDKVNTLAEQYRGKLGPWSSAVRAALGRGPQDELTASDFIGVLEQDPAFKNSYAARKALAMLAEKYGTEAGLTTAKVAEQRMLERDKRKSSDTLKSVATRMAADPEFAQLLKTRGITLEDALSGGLSAVELQPFVERAERSLEASKVNVAERTGVGVEQAKLDQPMTPEERAKHVVISEMMKGRYVQPPLGTTRKGMLPNGVANDVAAITDKQRNEWTALQPAQNIVNNLYSMSSRLVTAQSPSEALKQGLRLSFGAAVKSDSIAAAYADAVEGYLDSLARSIGGQRGVLTDRDITRVRRSLTSFFDTVQTRQLKNAVVQDIISTSQGALIGEITGTPIDLKGKVDALLKRLDDVTNKGIVDAVGVGKQVIRDKSGNMRVMPKRELTPEEAKAWEIVQ